MPTSGSRAPAGACACTRKMRGPKNAPLTVLCLHGLTRNVADFGFIADHLSARYRVIAADQRGRGKSQCDPQTANYRPTTYVADMFGLLDQLAIERVAVIGTSMGGIMAMLMGAMQPRAAAGHRAERYRPRGARRGIGAAASLPERANAREHLGRGVASDTAPERDGLSRLRRGRLGRFCPTHVYARSCGPAGPSLRPRDSRGIEGNRSERSAAGYVGILAAAPGAIPILAIRGALSDILSAETLISMGERHPNLTALTLPNRGHAPMLDEPAAVAAIDEFLKRLEP